VRVAGWHRNASWLKIFDNDLVHTCRAVGCFTHEQVQDNTAAAGGWSQCDLESVCIYMFALKYI